MTLYVMKNNAHSVLDSGITAIATTLDVLSGEGANFPSTFPFLVTVWDVANHPNPSDDSDMEIMEVTGRITDALTVIREKESTFGFAHLDGAKVAMLITAGIFNDSTYGISANITGDMLAATYDPTSVAGDAFDMAQMVEATNAKVLTSAERIILGNISGTNTGDQNAAGVSIADSGNLITATDVEGALAENRTAIDLNTTHKSSDGSDHSFINQDVKNTATPEFAGIQLTTGGSAPAHSEGQIFWDEDAKTITIDTNVAGVRLQLGQEMYVRCVNDTGLTIADGAVVYISGASGNRPTIALGGADTEAASDRIIGVSTQSIANLATGFVTTIGIVRDLNTNAWVVGTQLYLSSTAGEFTDTAPVSPKHKVCIAIVLVQSLTEGQIYVDVKTLGELDDIHDVLITTVTDDDILQYNSATGVWENIAIINQDVRSGTSPTFDGTNITGVLQSNVDITIGGTPDIDNLEELMFHTGSVGTFHSTDGVITDEGTTKFQVAAGEGLLRLTGTTTAPLISMVWSQTDILYTALVSGTVYYIYVENVAGTPTVQYTSTSSNIDHIKDIDLGFIWYNGENLIVNNPASLYNLPDRQHESIGEMLGYVRVYGAAILEPANLKLALTASEWYLGFTEFLMGAIDTNVADTFTYFHQNTGVWTEVATQTSIDVTNYNDTSSGLSALTVNRYGVHWVYLNANGGLYVVYGIGDYTIALAEAATIPTSLPPQFDKFCKIVGKVIVQKGAAAFYALESPFIETFTAGTATVHNDLGGLDDDDYKHFSAANYTDLTDGGDSTLHYHATDRTRTNHTGTQVASTISDFDTEVSNNSSVVANTAKNSYPSADSIKLGNIEPLADVTDAVNVGTSIYGSLEKTVFVDADNFAIIDSAAANVLKRITGANFKAALKTYYDTIYVPLSRTVAGKALSSNVTIDVGDLGNCTIATPTVDQFLKYNGSNWFNGDCSVISAGAGISFYLDDTKIIEAGTGPQTKVLETLLKEPSGGAEQEETVTVNNNTVLIDQYMWNTALGTTSIAAGPWSFETFCAVDISTAISEVITAIGIVSVGTGTIAITGTGVSRTAIVSGDTPFVSGDYNADITQTGHIITPNGIFEIIGYTSSTEVTIETLSTYTNETGVAYSLEHYQFQSSTGNIDEATASRKSESPVESAITIVATDKLTARYFGKTTHTSNVVISLFHNGSEHYTRFVTPLAILHNDLPEQQGGSSNERYHLTAAQHTVVGNTSGTNTGDQTLRTDVTLPFTDNTTNDSSTSKHGYLKKLSNVSTEFMNGVGGWATPAGGSVGVEKIGFPVESAYLPATNPASLVEEVGSTTYAGQSVLQFDDTVAKHAVFRSPGIIDYGGGDMVINMQAKPTTTPASAKTLIFHIYAVGVGDSEAYDAAVPVDTGVDITFNFSATTLQTDMMKATATITQAQTGIADGDKMVLEFIRNVATDDLIGHGEMIGFDISYERT